MDIPPPVTETMKEIKILSDQNKEYLILIKIINLKLLLWLKKCKKERVFIV